MFKNISRSIVRLSCYSTRFALVTLFTSSAILTVVFARTLTGSVVNESLAPPSITKYSSGTINPDQPQNTSTIRTEVIRITATPTGFEPNGLELPAGNYLLALDNESGLDEIIPQLNRIAGNGRTKLHELKASLKQLRRRNFITLHPGDYELAEAGHPNWVCHILVKEN